MLTAPFNFVPLSSKVFYPDWADQVSQDVPFSDGEDGVIELEITNHTPLFTRNGHRRDENTPYSSHILNPDGTRRYFIPGSTLRGCFRSVLEIMSFGKMERYVNNAFAMPREFDTKKSDNADYMKAVKHVSCGWLQKQENSYVLYPCTKGIQKIRHEDVKRKFPTFSEGEDHETAECKQTSLCEGETYPTVYIKAYSISYKENNKLYDVPEGKYRVVCTGYIKGKKHEYLFSEEENKSIEVPRDVFETFESIHQYTEYYAGHSGKMGFLAQRLYTGERIPVFYTQENGKITAMGITRFFRYPYAYQVRDLVNNACPMLDRAKLDLPDILFGCINKTESSNSLKGRVIFSHAFCRSIISDNQLRPLSGILGTPKASYYPYYLTQDSKGNEYVTYKTIGATIAGRKRYRISDGSLRELPNNEKENQNVQTRFNAMPAGLTFCGQVVVHNVRKAEMGALFSAILMNETKGCYHNLGLAKSFGYGKFSCSVKLNGLKYSVEEYLRAFETEMYSAGFNMCAQEPLNKLVSIASEHKSDIMAMMSLDEYEENKKNSNFSVLNEKTSQLRTFLDEEYIQRYEIEKKKAEEECAKRNKVQEQMRTDVECAKKDMDVSHWKNALQSLKTARELASQIAADTTNIDQLISKCEAQLQAEATTPLEQKLAGKTSLGNIQGTVDKWCKTSEQDFSDIELQVLKQAVVCLPEKEQKRLPSFRTKFEKSIGKDWTDKLYQLLQQ